MSRLTLSMSVLDSFVALADGNPGALFVLMALREREAGIFDILHLDDLGIYGEDIWTLYKDECGEDLERMHNEIIRRQTSR